ncbi:MAG: 4Fe-4S dicluster domain-containing protein [Nitrospirae bacterium]|nr:4Fe-4S dicluster domain-containing protein [Nitrospirota bacterium]
MSIIKNRILEKNYLSYWLRQLRNNMRLIAPLRQGGEDIVFTEIQNIHEIALDCPTSLPSPKEFLFPQFEPFLRKTGSGISDLKDSSKRVIFGVRSCDVSAVNILDRFFLRGFKDPYYASRRENTFFISIVCGKPDETCFCSGLGTGPYLKKGFDIQLYDLGDRYLVQSGSNEAEHWLNRYSFLMRNPDKTDLEDLFEIELSSKAMFQKRISLGSARQAILSGNVKDDFWQKVTDRCFECGGCVYECPLCTCFTVIDRTYEDEIVERARLWDSCLFKGFTRLAGGIIPGDKRLLRTKRWFFHKLIHYPETLGAYGCVGCGRCTITCPASIDMASVLINMKEEIS